jgi:hypothetical protein
MRSDRAPLLQKPNPFPSPVPDCCWRADGADHVAPGVWWTNVSLHDGHEPGWTELVETSDNDVTDISKMWITVRNVTHCPYCKTDLSTVNKIPPRMPDESNDMVVKETMKL